MFGRVYSGGVSGVDAYKIEVEVDCSGGMGQIHIVGLPDAAVKESQERVRSAIKSCEFLMPPGKKWIVNLAPADTRKEGPAYDLPIAVGVLAATGLVPLAPLANFWMFGELGLDGGVRPVVGALPIALSARSAGASAVIVPEANAEEASLVENLPVYPVSHLKQVLGILGDPRKGSPMTGRAREMFEQTTRQSTVQADFSDVKGQRLAKRALMIAAAGRHNILLVGVPGSGKSMLAQRLPSIMPPLSFDEAVELTKLYSVAGMLVSKGSVISQRPFRAPHHSASIAGLVGGGGWPRPGEISLAHLGVLFLDELTEFPRNYLDALRQPLETGSVLLSRVNQCLCFPADFLLVGACNPCPCGYRGDQLRPCLCTQYQADRYWHRLSGPFLDRIDLHVHVARLPDADLVGGPAEVGSTEMRMHVMAALERQKERSGDGRLIYNSQLNQKQIKRFCDVDQESRSLLLRAVVQLGMSARGYDRVLRVARTIADLAGCENIQRKHVAEALQYRAQMPF